MKSKLYFILSFAIVLMAIIAVESFAGTVWDAGGNANTNWSRSQNWGPVNGVPVSGSNVSFGTGGSIATVDSNRTAGLITFNRNANFTIDGLSTLTINSGITATQARTYTITAPINLGGTNTWSTSTASTVLNINSSIVSTQSVIINGSGTVNLNTNNEQFGSLTLNSSILGVDFRTIILDSNATFNGGTLRLSVGNSTSYGQIIAGNTTSGNINLGNGTTSLNLSSTGYVAQDFDKIWLLNNNSDGNTNGYFTGLVQGSSIVVGGVTMYMFYNANYGTGSLFGGNDILLAVPEPSSLLILLLGCSVVLLVRPQRSTKE